MRRASTGASLVTIALACAFVSPTANAAAADFDSFIVPGTDTSIVIANRPFSLVGASHSGAPDPYFHSGKFGDWPGGVNDTNIDDSTVDRLGRIVLSGFVTIPTRGDDGKVRYIPHVVVARFHRLGRPDRSFGGGDGIVVSRVAGRGENVVVRPDLSIFVAGSTPGHTPLLIKLHNDGSLDRGFAQSGIRRIRPRGGSTGSLFEGTTTDLLSQPGRVVLSIYGHFGRGPHLSLLAGYEVDGGLDQRFGTGGTIEFEAPGVKHAAYGMGSTPRGGLVAVSSVANSNPERLAVVRLRPNGHLDRSYGVAGVAAGPAVGRLGFDVGLALDYFGAASVAAETAADPLALSVTRFTAEGAIDQEFGVGGQTEPLFGTGRISTAFGRHGDTLLVAAFEGNAPSRELVYRFGERGALLSTVAVAG